MDPRELLGKYLHITLLPSPPEIPYRQDHVVTVNSGTYRPMGLVTNNGELVSLVMDGKELMHGGGKPKIMKTDKDNQGWGHSEIAMFPVVGPVPGYQVKTSRGTHILDQHGISRLLPWGSVERGIFGPKHTQKHVSRVAKRFVYNPRSAENPASPRALFWNHSFELQKQFGMRPMHGMLTVEFILKNTGITAFPYMFGWHPAFTLQGDPESAVFYGYTTQEVYMNEPRTEFTFEDIIHKSKNGALLLDDISRIIYKQEERSTYEFIFQSPDFNKMMVWTPGADSGMFCIEPVTHFPSGDPKQRYFEDHDLVLEPGKEAKYRVHIMR